MGLPLVFDTFNLQSNERDTCMAALAEVGNIVEASKLLGITRHALKRRIVKHRITYPSPAEHYLRVTLSRPQRTMRATTACARHLLSLAA